MLIPDPVKITYQEELTQKCQQMYLLNAFHLKPGGVSQADR